MSFAAAGSMTAWVFQFRSSHGLATGVICTSARYASVLRHGAERPDRRHVAPALWRRLEHELADTLPATPLPAASAVVEALVPVDERRSIGVQYVTAMRVDPEPVGLVGRLDELLRLGAGKGWAWGSVKLGVKSARSGAI